MKSLPILLLAVSLTFASCSSRKYIEIQSEDLDDTYSVKYLAKKDWEMSVPVCLEIWKNDKRLVRSRHLSYEDPNIFDGKELSLKRAAAGGIHVFFEKDEPDLILGVFDSSPGFLYPAFGITDPSHRQDGDRALAKYLKATKESKKLLLAD